MQAETTVPEALRNPVRRFVVDIGRYLPATLVPALLTLAGAMLFTRIFTPAEYGLFSLVLAISGPVGIVLMEWAAQAVGRYYAEYWRRGEEELYRSVITLLVLGLVCAVPLAGFVIWVVLRLAGRAPSVPLFAGVVALVLLQGMYALASRMLPVTFNSQAYRRAAGLLACLALGFSLALIALFGAQVVWLVWGLVLANVVAVPYAAHQAGLSLRPSRRLFAPEVTAVLRRFVSYGLPMAFYFLASNLLTMSDRYVIQWFDGAEAVGIYAVNYNLVMQVLLLTSVPLMTAARPILMHQWEQHDRRAVRNTITTMTDICAVIGIGLAGLIAVTGEQVARLVLGAEFAGGYVVMLPVAIGVAIWSCAQLGHKSAELTEQTKVMLWTGGLAAAVNLALNLLLVPVFGYVAAAYTTLASYALYAALIWWQARRLLPWEVPWRNVGVSVLAAGGAWFVADAVRQLAEGNSSAVAGLVGVSVAFVASYAGLILLMRRRQLGTYVSPQRLFSAVRMLMPVLLFAVVGWNWQVPVSAAQAIEPYTVGGFEQFDDTGDGRPDRAELRCECITDQDRITIVDGAANMTWAERVEEGADMSDDLWLFDVANRGYYQLAVQFGRDGAQLTAAVFQDQDGDGQVAVREESGSLHVSEPGFPAVQLVALDGYWQRDGRPAEHLDLLVDDAMLATYGAERFQDLMLNDGVTDVVIRVRGPRDGDPRSFDWRNVYTPFSESAGFYRTTLMVREEGQEPPYAPVFPWYLLGSIYGQIEHFEGGAVRTRPLEGSEGRPYGIVKSYGESFAPLQVDWSIGRIAYIGEFVASRGSEHNWFTYSVNRIEPGVLTNPNFESPFAFYDLAGDDDGTPEMQVRIERNVPDDPFALPQWHERTYQQIRYSWDQSNDGYWDYKVALLGQHDLDGTVAFPEFALQTVPYDELPGWVTGHTWDVATFVAAETLRYLSSEGIYEWGLGGAFRDEFYAGVGSAPADGTFSTILEGTRGEYQLEYQAQPGLYYSPVDHRLHLLGAAGGVYSIDEERRYRIVYRNLDGDDYIDAWNAYEGDELLAQLHQLDNGLLYSAGREVLLLEAAVAREEFRTALPTTSEEWAALGGRLDEFAADLAADDLRGMVTQERAAPVVIDGATLRDVQVTESGPAFILELAPGFDAGTFPINGLGGPGRYAVHYDTQTGQFTAAPAAPAAPTIAEVSTTPELTALESSELTIQIANDGDESLLGADVAVYAARAGGPKTLLVETQLDLAGRQTVAVQTTWSPPRAGAWELFVELRTPGKDAVELREALPIEKSAGVGWTDALAVGWPAGLGRAYLVALLALAALFACGSFVLVRRVA